MYARQSWFAVTYQRLQLFGSALIKILMSGPWRFLTRTLNEMKIMKHTIIALNIVKTFEIWLNIRCEVYLFLFHRYGVSVTMLN